MTCGSPAPLTDDQLTALLDGEADAALRQHVTECPCCAAQLRDARRIERMATSSLRRWDCPPPQQLNDYHFALLAADQRQHVLDHLHVCAACTAELNDLRAFMAAPALLELPQPKAVSSFAARLGEVIGQLLPQTPMHALRGAASEPIIADAAGTMVILDVQPAGDAKVAIIGQVVADDQHAWTGALVEFRQSNQLLMIATVSDLGGFRCGALAAGSTEIRLTPSSGRTTIVLSSVMLQAASDA